MSSWFFGHCGENLIEIDHKKSRNGHVLSGDNREKFEEHEEATCLPSWNI